jgi:Protein of unknown function (DUF3500)
VTSVDGLARAVLAWLDGLDEGQRRRATFPFEADVRFAWHWTPITHEGLALADMSTVQRRSAMRILRDGLGARGAAETEAVIALETTLGELEREEGRDDWRRRDPTRYWFAVFGDPSGRAGAWSWRVVGHHVTAHVTVLDGRVIASTPSFLGANPAVVPSGPRAGYRALSGEETLARELLMSLSGAQRTVAVVDPVAPPEILSGAGRRAIVEGIADGIPRSAMDPAQQERLDALIRHYLERARDEVAGAAWDGLVAAGLDAITFAWAGPAEPGRGHYYAVRGPSFLLEYDNTQNGANHIHAVWRDLVNDWGEDALAAHYRAAHA